MIDFTTLLPGPLATLLLRRAGAEVIKIEPPGGEAMRTLMGDGGAAFGFLNRGKRSVCADLKNPRRRDAVRALCAEADVVVEQFRPGVMDRLGLGWEALREGREALVYCSITGYGRSGGLRDAAGHDINYLAESGLFSLFRDQSQRPTPPPVLLADVVGGAYPAFSNILLALFQRLRTGRGAHVDVAMTRGLQALSVSAVAAVEAGRPPGGSPLDGSAANYRCYRCADGEWLAVGALEGRFWARLCELLELPAELAADPADARAVEALGARFASQPARRWHERFRDQDVCCSPVRTLAAALAEIAGEAGSLGGLPLPLAPDFDRGADAPAPALGEGDEAFLSAAGANTRP